MSESNINKILAPNIRAFFLCQTKIKSKHQQEKVHTIFEPLITSKKNIIIMEKSHIKLLRKNLSLGDLTFV